MVSMIARDFCSTVTSLLALYNGLTRGYNYRVKRALGDRRRFLHAAGKKDEKNTCNYGNVTLVLLIARMKVDE